MYMHGHLTPKALERLLRSPVDNEDGAYLASMVGPDFVLTCWTTPTVYPPPTLVMFIRRHRGLGAHLSTPRNDRAANARRLQAVNPTEAL